jgi:integrase
MKLQRSAATEAAYQTAARRHLRRAHTRHPDAAPLDGLVLSVAQDSTIIRGSTARLYKQELLTAVDILVLDGRASASSRADAVERIGKALAARSGTPEKPRTASLKVKDATEAEALAVFRQLAKRARGRANTHLICMLALYVYIVPRLGCRPVEWLDASVEGKVLRVRSAKFGNGRSGFKERSIDLSEYDPRVIKAVEAFAHFAPLSAGEAASLKLWRNALAELLARACARCEVRRLSLYSFRHVALATWKRAGLAPWEIAALAGHASIRSASAYAGKSKGWLAPAIPRADPERIAALEALADHKVDGSAVLTDKKGASPPRVRLSPYGGFDSFDDMPVPKTPAPDTVRVEAGATLARQHRQKLAALAQSVLNDDGQRNPTPGDDEAADPFKNRP